MGDFTYRTREDVETWKLKCPIQSLRRRMVEQKIAADAEFAAIDQEVTQLIAEAQEFAERSAWPTAASATTHVYSPVRQPAAPEPSSSPDSGAPDSGAAREITG